MKMPETITLRIKLSGYRRGEDDDEWAATIEIPEDSTLVDLHNTIQDLIQFDNDHVYEFYAGRTWRQHKVEFGESGSPFEAPDYEEYTLSEVYALEKGYKLYYHFDFGDDWIFEIRIRRGRKPMSPNVNYPRVIETTGDPPEQYDDYNE